ncbi:MAG TPA: hypothetical protein PLM80_01280 [Mesotoga sp.]|jgi:uncharacterized protein YqhQ|uniref:Uncharacterized protein n=1 Tax=Mesotoga infera TaxID=1236046 RepID=A0A7Z7PP89_9BACT|nr:hypothetical protein [Mesotoga infera]MBP7199702.1 hypothetical protein [Mesotoga sp.]MDI9375420.1 hypothetical protein [Thermotogota bacterium]NLX34201.1 hypothetical protein [Thermotogaceae bacterium]MDD4041185.1 hypothetical protein [Mesotoga sp.]MDD4477773.1 hypothetical protein [Mesotoga sp.]
MTFIYILIAIYIASILLYYVFKKASKWEWVMSAMILIPLILRIFLIK